MRLLLTLSVGALVVACSNKDPDPGATTLPRATTTSTMSDADRYAIPDTITADYVNDVLLALNEVYGDVVRKRIETRQLTPQDLVPLRAIYSAEEFEQQAAALAKSPFGSPEDYRSPMGNRRITVNELLATESMCVAVQASYDFSAVATNPPPPMPVWVVLRPKDATTDPEGVNPTPWIIAAEELDEGASCAS